MTKLIHAGSSENGDSGWNGKAKAGDQTGREVCVRDFYEKPWNVMLRYPNKTLCDKVMEIAKKLAACNLVGYNQSRRNTLYNALKSNDFDVDKYISSGVKTETDCSAFVYACWCCVLAELRYDGNAPTTSSMRSFFKLHGFIEYHGSSYLKDTEFLKNGDIEIKEGEHTAMVYLPDDYILNPELDYAFDVIARDVIAGHWGNGETRKDKLYKEIQKHVNNMVK